MLEAHPPVDVVLLRPADGQTWKLDPLLESMGVGFLAAALEREGVRFEIVDNYFEQLDDRALLRRLVAYQPRLLGVSISHQFPNMWPLFELIRAFKHQCPQTLVAGGGHFASFRPDVLLQRSGFDVVAIGEGDSTIVQLLRAARNGGNLGELEGVCFLKNDELVRTAPAPLPDVASLPRPLRPYLDRLHRKSPELVRKSWHSVSRSRGCLAACSYCSVGAFSRLGSSPSWRTRPAGLIIDELRWLNQRYSIRRVRFADDEFAGFGPSGEAAAQTFAESMIQSGLSMEFMISMRVEHATPGILRPLRNAGASIVLLGIEAGNPEDLTLYSKGATLSKADRAIEAVLGCGLQVVLALIPFHPWSTLERVRATVDWVSRQIRPGVIVEPSVLLNRLSPLVGTAMESRFQAAGISSDLYLNRESLSSYPFRDAQVAQLYASCEHFLQPHAVRIESAIADADFGLEQLRESLSTASLVLRRALFAEVRHSLQARFLGALQRMASASNPETEGSAVDSCLHHHLRACRSQLRLALAGGESPGGLS